METVSSILAVAFISKPSGRTEEQGKQTRERKLCGLAAHPSFPAQSPLLTAPEPAPRPLAGQPHAKGQPGPALTTWRPLALSVEGGTKLIKISLTAQPQLILTHAGSCQNSDLGAEEKEQEGGKGTNLQPRPTGMGRAHRCPRGLSWETCPCALLTEQQ